MLSTLLNVTGLPIGPRPQEHISSVSPKLVSSGRVLCIAIPNAREDESFADDLNTKRGIVSSRVALLLRSTEIQPAVSKIRALRAPLLSYSIEFLNFLFTFHHRTVASPQGGPHPHLFSLPSTPTTPLRLSVSPTSSPEMALSRASTSHPPPTPLSEISTLQPPYTDLSPPTDPTQPSHPSSLAAPIPRRTNSRST